MRQWITHNNNAVLTGENQWELKLPGPRATGSPAATVASFSERVVMSNFTRLDLLIADDSLSLNTNLYGLKHDRVYMFGQLLLPP